MAQERLFSMPFATIYPLYVAKVERKNRTVAELDEVLCWFTGHSPASLHAAAESDQTMREFFEHAPGITPHAALITGVVCGIRVEDIGDPLMQKIRYMDKLVDELAKGKALVKIMRSA
ncbi:DUF2200 domain-containing protein [Corynebacterium breve]|uniref:DUF2200 domain-containing protein n=1 Tax=Corynebacterium breve TaxID=3049799 RepID=A0ABY8VLN4_9CORY|nr:DUF2200 domain-containing protein [Corynebacterium breve]WIM68465.1 DUF2200 domain-containing protein [Corynebacterium breve]